MGRKKKSRDNNWSEWTDKRNPTATTWALKYLRKKNLLPLRVHPDETVKLASVPLPKLPPQMTMDKFFDLMKKAWKAKRTRDRADKRGVKALQVYLSEAARNTLKRQSALTQRPMNNILEDLINSTFPSLDKTSPRPATPTPSRAHSSALHGHNLMPDASQPQKESQILREALERIDRLEGEIHALKNIVESPPSPREGN